MPDENSTLKLTELMRQASEEGDEEKLLALTKRITRDCDVFAQRCNQIAACTRRPCSSFEEFLLLP